MLGYFPTPYEDELLYSMIARYGIHTGQLEQKKIISSVFGSKSVAAVPDLPSHLDAFTERVSRVWRIAVDDIIQKHTLAPLYLPFLDPDQADLVIASMHSSYGGNIHTRAGITASQVKQPSVFRYCPKCIEEQESYVGERYWLRSHQLAGLPICGRHELRLIDSDFHFHHSAKYFFQAAQGTIEKGYPKASPVSPLEALVATHLNNLLQQDIRTRITKHQWSLFYQHIAKESGLWCIGHIDHSKIAEEISSKFHDSTFENYTSRQSIGSWSTNLFRKHRKSFNPLQHSLAWAALAPNYSTEQIIDSVQQLPRQKLVKQNKAVSCVEKAVLTFKRKSWISLTTRYQDQGVKQLRCIENGSALYSWLYRNDREWLVHHTPTIKRDTSHSRVDWQRRDNELYRKLQNLLGDLQAQPPDRRISKTYLLSLLGTKSSLEKHLADLPKLKNLLEQNCESVEAFQTRRILKLWENALRQGVQLPTWELKRLAGLSETISPNVQHLLECIANTRNFSVWYQNSQSTRRIKAHRHGGSLQRE